MRVADAHILGTALASVGHERRETQLACTARGPAHTEPKARASGRRAGREELERETKGVLGQGEQFAGGKGGPMGTLDSLVETATDRAERARATGRL